MRRLAAAVTPAFSAGPALAHTGQGFHDSVLSGLAHPILGADHLLAMVAIGILAAMQGRAARLAIPAAFVTAMGTGLAAGAAGMALPLVEPMIIASLLVLGALLALAARPSLMGGVVMAAFFGLFHGAAHGVEVGAASTLPFAAGVLAATGLLHAVGALVGSRLGGLPMRFLGAGLTFGGLALALS